MNLVLAELETPTPGRARGLALARASGDWVLTLRAGDRVFPSALGWLADAAEGASLGVLGGRAGWRDPRGLRVELPREDPLWEEFLACSREALAALGDPRLLCESLGILSGPAIARALEAGGGRAHKEGDWIALGPIEDRFEEAARGDPVVLLDQIEAAAELLGQILPAEEFRDWRRGLELRAIEAYCDSLGTALHQLAEGSAPLVEGSVADRALHRAVQQAARGLSELPARLRRGLEAHASESLGRP